MTYIFRTAKASDAVVCEKIQHDWVEATSWIPKQGVYEKLVEENWWADFFETEKAWVAENDDCIIGFCARQNENNNIAALYVAAEFRRSGVGKCLLDLAKVDCDQIIVWAFELNENARNFYLREGLIEVGRELDDDLQIIDVEHHWTNPSL